MLLNNLHLNLKKLILYIFYNIYNFVLGKWDRTVPKKEYPIPLAYLIFSTPNLWGLNFENFERSLIKHHPFFNYYRERDI
jgi:hypothetical protein